MDSPGIQDSRRFCCVLKVSIPTSYRYFKPFSGILKNYEPLNPKLLQYLVLYLDDENGIFDTMK